MHFLKLPVISVIGVICDQEVVGPHTFQIAGDKYIKALAQQTIKERSYNF
jgi:hypothetical protein